MAEFLKNELPQKVIRAFVVSLADSDKILNSIKEGRDFSCLIFYLGVKSGDQSSGFKGKRRLTFFVGKIGEFENLKEAIQREVGEELSITGLGLPRFTEIGSWKYKIGDHEREVIIVYIPVSCLPEERMVIGDGKIIDFKTLTLSQLRQTIEEGTFDDLPLEEHLEMKADSSNTFSISSEDKNRRNQSLQKGLSWMEHIERYLQRKINSLIELCIDENGNFDEEKFKKEYEKLRSYFMK